MLRFIFAVVIVFSLSGTLAFGQASSTPEVLDELHVAELVQPGPSPSGYDKYVYKNDYASFQFYLGQNTAYYTLWHRVYDPQQGCTILIKKTYLSSMIALPIEHPQLRIWQNTEQSPHAIQWGISRQSHDGCHFKIYYRRPDGHWRYYGSFELDTPR